jgi:hypothetical protein
MKNSPSGPRKTQYLGGSNTLVRAGRCVVLRDEGRVAFFAAALLALPPLAPVAAIASDTGKTYHVTATTTTGSELNQATHSHNYNSLSRYVVIFWAQDRASVIDCGKINLKQNLIRSLCHRSLNARALLLAHPTDHRGK